MSTLYIIRWEIWKMIVTSPPAVFRNWSQFSPRIVYIIKKIKNRNNTTMIEHKT